MTLLAAISYGFNDLLRQKKYIFLVFGINLIFGALALPPIQSILKDSIGSTHYPTLLNQDFDFVIWTDILRENLLSFGIGFKLFFTIITIYFMWTIFYIGGFTGLALNRDEQKSLNFWANGARFFFRFFRLSIYIILFYLLIALLLIWFTGIADLHILELDSEIQLISKFKIAIGILLICIFLVSVFKELTKIEIAHSDESFISIPVIKALKGTFSVRYLSLGLVLTLILAIVYAIYFFITVRLDIQPMFLSILVIPQILLLVKVSIRYVRISTFTYLRKSA